MIHRATTVVVLGLILSAGGCATDNDAPAGPAPAAADEPAKERVLGLPAGWGLAPTGAAQLSASQTPGEVIVRATGEFPSSNYEAKLFPSPLRIWPPQYMLARRKTGDIGAQVITPFDVTATFKAKDPVREVVVSDAGGARKVAVDQARD